MRILSALLGAALAFAPMAAAHAGTLYYSEDDNSNGLFELSLLDGSATLLGASGVTSNTVGLAPSGTAGELYGSQFFNILEIAADGSGATTLGGANAEGLAFDPVGNVLYFAINGDFGTVNLTTGEIASTLADPGSDVEGLAWGNGGVYGLDTNSDVSFYDPNTDTWSAVGTANIATGFNKGLAFDPGLNLLYMISGQDQFLYSYDPVTNITGLIGDTGRRTAAGGLAFVTAVPEPSTLGLFALGALGLGAGIRRRRKLRIASSEA